LILAPSILSADFGHLAEQIQLVERAGAKAIHVDVMDGHFVPNLTLGPAVVRAARRATTLPLDVHLMIESAERYLDVFIEAGASWISLHVEAMVHLQRSIGHLRDKGVSPGVALNPATPLPSLAEILPELDFVLVMSVNPGFAGQRFLPKSLEKIRRLKAEILARRLETRIEVDGGIDSSNIQSVVDAGAEIVVAGSAVFAQSDPAAAVRLLMASGS